MDRRSRRRAAAPIVAAVLAAAALLAGDASAASFFLQVQGVAAQGRAFAGSVASGGDASTVWSNPAGMPFLGGAETQFGVNVVLPSAEIEDRGSTIDRGLVPSPVDPAAVGGGDGRDPYDTAFVPYNYVALPVTADGTVWVGAGLGAPFGLSNDWGEGWFGRYDATASRLKVYDGSLVAAWRPVPWLAIGGGIDLSYAEVRLESAVPSPSPAGADGILEVEGDSFAVGFNLGVMLEPVAGTRIGLSYRSGIDHDFDGDATLTGLPGIDFGTGISAALQLPAMASIGLRQQVTPEIAVYGSATWYGWSSFREIRVVRDDGGDDLVTATHYRDTVGFAIGADYALTDALTLRAGFQYDPTPTTEGYRSARTPDADRYWASAGLSWAVTEHLTLDFAYTHMMLDGGATDTSAGFFDGTPAATRVDYARSVEASVDVLSAAVRYRF
jgi:long-chain fatty acid transport protein